MKKEIIQYCESDVEFLMKACMRFRDIFMAETTVDPFNKSLTIAGACNLVYRKLFFKPETIAIIPHNGYRAKDKQSAIAINWMRWVEQQEGIKIQSAFNGREATIGPYKVDGICDLTIYEFYGCYWHGCKVCLKKRNRVSADGYRTAREAYDMTPERKNFLKTQVYEIIEK